MGRTLSARSGRQRRTIGVDPGKKFAFKELSAGHKAAILFGMKDGEKKVEEKVANIGKSVNGWHVGSEDAEATCRRVA